MSLLYINKIGVRRSHAISQHQLFKQLVRSHETSVGKQEGIPVFYIYKDERKESNTWCFFIG